INMPQARVLPRVALKIRKPVSSTSRTVCGRAGGYKTCDIGEYYGMGSLTTLQRQVQGLARLAAALDPPQLDAELLLAHALGISRTRLKSHPEEPWQPAEAARYLALVERRARGEPLAYITGRRDF